MEIAHRHPTGTIGMRSQYLSLALVGLAIGWLAGLSVSPVAASVVTGLLGLVASLGAGACLLGSRLPPGSREGADDEPDPISWLDVRPAAVLAVAVASSVPAGILVRTHELLAPAGQRGAQERGSETASRTPALFADVLDRCDELLALSRDPDTDYFRQRVSRAGDVGERLGTRLPDETLRDTVQALCTPSSLR